MLKPSPRTRVQALAPGVRRCFLLDMLPGGRRDGQLVRCEPAVEATGEMAVGPLSPVFIRKHPRFYPVP